MRRKQSKLRNAYLHIYTIGICSLVLAAVLVVAISATLLVDKMSGEDDESQLSSMEAKETYTLMADATGADGDADGDAEQSLIEGARIVCWGDSMTEGIGNSVATINNGSTIKNISYYTFPQTLQELTGISTLNFGVAGATSEEIAIMQGGLTPTKDLDDYDTINYDVMEAAEDCNSEDILIIEMGSNGGWYDYDELIAQYQAMIDSSGCSNYIIVGDTDDPGTSMADESQTFRNADGSFVGTNNTVWEDALEEAFGEHFVNVRVYMIENGLSLCGLKTTMMDKMYARKGFISTQLRADWTHFNSYGYYVQGVAIYEKGVELGYWN